MGRVGHVPQGDLIPARGAGQQEPVGRERDVSGVEGDRCQWLSFQASLPMTQPSISTTGPSVTAVISATRRSRAGDSVSVR
jgi:hypothetical protein